jgi:hypothetical protein
VGQNSILFDRGLEDLYQSWSVSWQLNEFSVRGPNGRVFGVYSYYRIILPIEIASNPTIRDTGYVTLKLDPARKVRMLDDVSMPELARFKRRLSAHVLAAVRQSPFGCSDCADEAKMSVFMWDGTVCSGCREYYCRNNACLRRLKLVVLKNGVKICRYCGTENQAPLDPASEMAGCRS